MFITLSNFNLHINCSFHLKLLKVAVCYFLRAPGGTHICSDICSKRLAFRPRFNVELIAYSDALRSVTGLHFRYYET